MLRLQTAAAEQEAIAAKLATDAAAATAESKFERIETIGGREFTFEAASDAELDHMILNAYKVAYAVQSTEPAEATPAAMTVDPAAAAQAAADQLAAKTRLEMQFKAGEITTAEYLEQSGAVDEYLASKGLPLDALRSAVEQTQSTQETQSWAEATELFRNGPAGSDWPGGDKNLKLIGRELAALGLVDATDKVAALAQAYQSMKDNGIVFPYEPPADAAAVAAPAAVAAASAAPAVIAAPVAPAVVRTAATSSSLFGKSSGVSGNPTTPAAPAKSDAEKVALAVAADASPAEIMAAWKAANQAAGKHPDDALRDAFGRSRA